MKKLQVCSILFLVTLLMSSSFSQDKPSLTGHGNLNYPALQSTYVIYDQMNYPGTNSITSQNYEPGLDNYDSFAADDFAFMEYTWIIESIDVLGVYTNGTGPANSVNVWIYTGNGTGGLPTDTIYSALNIIPSAGLANGSFSIPLPVAAVLIEGWYWLCVQANMDYASGGQWLWTERTFQDFSESAWKNPGGAYSTSCSPNWGYRVTNCGVGTQPDNCFRLNGYVIPVELISFIAQTEFDKVILSWSTATETNNQGFEVEREVGSLPDGEAGRQSAVGNSVWERIGYVPGYGTTTDPKSYSFIDSEVSTGKYTYRLKQIDFDGSYDYSQEVNVEVTAPLEFALEQNFPNPFNPNTKISWQSPVGSHQTIKVFDVLGNEVATIVDEYKPAGRYEVEFNASRLASGIYFYKLQGVPIGRQAGEYTAVKKMIFLK